MDGAVHVHAYGYLPPAGSLPIHAQMVNIYGNLGVVI